MKPRFLVVPVLVAHPPAVPVWVGGTPDGTEPLTPHFLVLLLPTPSLFSPWKAEVLMERWRARSVPVQEHFESLEPVLALRCVESHRRL